MNYISRQAFKPFHARDDRWACIVAHRRAGKTVACINELIARASRSKKDNARFGYIAPYYGQAKQIAWDYLKQYARPAIKVAHEADLQVELINGARVRLYGADNPDSLRGVYFDGVILDEYADMRPSVWSEIIRPALADRKGWAVFIGTPKGFNEFYKIHKHAQEDPEWFSLILKASQSGLLDHAELADAAKTMSKDQYNQEFECSFDAPLIGAYYGAEIAEAKKEGRIAPVPYSRASEVFTAWDIGFGDSTAIWFAQYVGREARVIDYYEASGVGIDHYAKVIKDRPYNYAKHILPHDADSGQLGTGKTIRQQLVEVGLKNCMVLGRTEIDAGINQARVLISQAYFDKAKCERGIECLRNYQRRYDEKNKVYSPTPLHNWASHGADAFRYLAVGMRPSTFTKPPSFSLEGFQQAPCQL